MPRLSLTMKEGTVGKWYKKEGEAVEKGEPIVEVISEKATYDLEAPASGVLRKILIDQGIDVPVDAVLAFITAKDEALPHIESLTEPPKTTAETEARVLASPSAKRLANEHGVDLPLVRGSGTQGRIDEDDVKRYIDRTSEGLRRVREIIPLRGLRKTSAERLSTSFRTAPHSTIMMEVDISSIKQLHGRKQVSYTAIILKAAAQALKEHPAVNSTLEKDQIKIFEDVNIGFAVATGNGLVAPVIRRADGKTLQEIDAAINDLTDKARNEKLAKEEVTGGTFTITNLGMYGVDFFTPIINPPEAAIMGIGRIVEKPIVCNGRIEIKPTVMLSLSYDHRIVDGAPSAEFLGAIKQKIEKTLAAEG